MRLACTPALILEAWRPPETAKKSSKVDMACFHVLALAGGLRRVCIGLDAVTWTSSASRGPVDSESAHFVKP